jgi:hypothetical protein
MLASKPENNNPDGEEMTSAARSGALARRAAQKANAHSAPCAAGQHIMKNENKQRWQRHGGVAKSGSVGVARKRGGNRRRRWREINRGMAKKKRRKKIMAYENVLKIMPSAAAAAKWRRRKAKWLRNENG